MNSKIDLFFIILFVIVVSVIIGLNIVTVIDKKISDISVNIPPLKIPQPTIVLNVSKDEKDKIKIMPCSKADNGHKNLIKDKQNVEKFIVSDAQDIQKYTDIKNKYLKKSDNFDKEKLDMPQDDEKCAVDYDNLDEKKNNNDRLEKAYITSADFGWSEPNHYVSCSNSSIANKFKTGKQSLKPYQISCGHPNKLTAENYYKTFYKKQIIPIEDYYVRGYNYMDYTDYPTPYQIRGLRILSQNTKGLPKEQTKIKNIPVGFNYAFHNTPAMPMP